MKHLLVPIGSTENASNSLQYAIDLASNIHAKVFVFRAYNVQTKAGTIINIDAIMQRETKLYLRTIINLVDCKNVDVKLISAKGSVVESIAAVHNELKIDLVVVGQKSNSIKDNVFLGATSGSIVKKTEIPVLVIPNGYSFTPFKTSLLAFKSGIIYKNTVLDPLVSFTTTFATKVNLLLVKTPNHTEEDLVLDAALERVKNSLTITDNATTFQGVLEHFQSHKPDLLVVFRRKRGFFKKLWEKNVILKEEFYCKVPLLVLSGKE